MFAQRVLISAIIKIRCKKKFSSQLQVNYVYRRNVQTLADTEEVFWADELLTVSLSLFFYAN